MDPTTTIIIELLKIGVTGLVALLVARLSKATSELHHTFNSRMDELKVLWQSEANLKGREEQRRETEAALASAEVVPVETRTEAKAKDNA